MKETLLKSVLYISSTIIFDLDNIVDFYAIRKTLKNVVSVQQGGIKNTRKRITFHSFDKLKVNTYYG